MGIENMTSVDQLNSISWQIHLSDILITSIVAFLILFVYSQVQRSYKKSSLKKFWKVSLREFGRIKKGVAIPPGDVICALNKLKRTEILVADILNEENFHDYLDKLDYFELTVKSTSGDMKFKIERIEEWLCGFV
ncbi:MAG: hypothetical protein ACREBB_09215 [Nitrosotalea sp.]